MEEKNHEKKFTICKKCGELIEYSSEDTYWDYSGCSYNVKLVKCNCCGNPIVLKYEEDSWMSNY